MAETLRKYKISCVTGDNYGAEFNKQAFEREGVGYIRSELNKSQLYLELLPVICSGEIELLDNDRLISQLSNLERKTRSGGKDSIDHPQGQHDDLANVVAGLAGNKYSNLKRGAFLR
jgi:hypothetical protein